ncbi:hypothetical protein [Campylobacter devanensis]|uniref:hypothetical protein n=1 Tax=Campylobacter devanensis TaxID=3161138 RepID=UPI00191C79E1|nr:hypothetical protein [Campylobacter sp. P160]
MVICSLSSIIYNFLLRRLAKLVFATGSYAPLTHLKSLLCRVTLIKIRGVSHPLEGFFKGLGVVKKKKGGGGEGVATVKKRSPSLLKKKNLNFLKIFIINLECKKVKNGKVASLMVILRRKFEVLNIFLILF